MLRWPETSGRHGWACSRSSPRCSSAASAPGCGSSKRSRHAAAGRGRPVEPAHGAHPTRTRPDHRRRRAPARRQRGHQHRRRRLGPDPQRRRPGDAVPAALGVARRARRRHGGPLRRRHLQPLPAAAARRGRARGRRDRDPGALRGLPRRLGAARLSPDLPLRAARVARDRLHGRDHGRDPGLLRQPRLRHLEPWRAGGPGRHRAAVRDHVARHVGQARHRDRRGRAGGARRQRDAAGQRPGHPALDRPRPAAVRRADAADAAAAEAGVHCAEPDHREARRQPSADGPHPGTRRRTTRRRPAR